MIQLVISMLTVYSVASSRTAEDRKAFGIKVHLVRFVVVLHTLLICRLILLGHGPPQKIQKSYPQKIQKS